MRKKILLGFMLSATVFATQAITSDNPTIPTSGLAAVADQPVFTCSAASYVIGNRSVGGSNVSDGYTLDLSTGEAVLSKSDLISGPNAFVNAIGYNTVDNYIWGVRSGTNQLVRIGSDWSVELFNVTGLPAPVPGFTTGDVGPDGILYLYTANSANITKIDLNAASANYLAAVTVPTTPTVLNDWSFNPTDGLLYGFGSDKTLYRFDPATGTRTTIGPVTGAGIEGGGQSGSFGTAFFDEGGNFFVGNNDSGAIFKIAAPLSDLTASLFSTTNMRPGDGARCATAMLGPSAVADTISTDCDAVDLLITANDIPGSSAIVAASTRLIDPLSSQPVTSVTISNQGVFTLDPATGTVHFEPVSGYQGVSTVSYRIADENNLEAQASISVTVDCIIPVQPTFTCSALSYVIGNRSVGGSNVSDGYTLDLSTGSAVLAKSDLISGPNAFINAIGYNTVDNYIWGVRSGTNQLVRIGSDWSVELFNVTGLPAPVPGFTTGDVGPDGILYLYAVSGSSITKIDLNAASANYLAAVTVPTTPTVLNDWSFNPTDGLLYAFGSDKTLYRFDPATGTRTTIGPVTGAGIEGGGQSGSFGTAFFDEGGNFFVGNNDSGAIFKIAAPLSDLTASLFSTTNMRPGDGARCATAMLGPSAVADTISTDCNGVDLPITANDIPGSSAIVAASTRLIDPISSQPVTSVTVSNQGVFTLDTTTATVHFQPVSGYQGVSTVSYLITDENNLEAQANISVTVDCIIPVQPTFTCSALSYVIGNRNVGGSNVSDGYTLDLSTGTAVLAKSPLISGPNAFVNAIGYNTVDNYIWGFRYNTHQLVRIGSDWSVEFFDVTGLPTTPPGLATGDVGPDGIMYLYAANGSSITKIDLNPGSVNYLAAVTVPTTPTNLNDWSFNPTDGQIYAFGTDKVLYRFNPATGARTTLGPVTGGGIEGQAGSFGTAFFDESGDFFVGNNTSGAIFKISAPLTSLTASLFSTTNMSPGDGARCANAVVLDPPVAVNDQGSSDCSTLVLNVATNDIVGSAPLVPSSVRLLTPGTGVRVTSLNIPGEGQYEVNTVTGAVSFTAVNGFSDTTFISYVIADTNSLEATGVISIIVDCPLPVTLMSFDASKENQTAILSWATTMETNSDRFEVERSTNGKNWSKIGTVKSHVESTILRNYTFTDLSPSSGENLYRLKMVDQDETFAYSRIRSLSFDAALKLTAYPNPASSRLLIQHFDRIKDVSIINRAGNKVLHADKVSADGIDVSGLTPGIYILTATLADGSISTHKIVVNR